MTFDEFLNNLCVMSVEGLVKVSRPLSVLDAAVLFAIDRIGERKGFPCETTEEEIAKEILTFTDETIFEQTGECFFKKTED